MILLKERATKSQREKQHRKEIFLKEEKLYGDGILSTPHRYRGIKSPRWQKKNMSRKKAFAGRF